MFWYCQGLTVYFSICKKSKQINHFSNIKQNNKCIDAKSSRKCGVFVPVLPKKNGYAIIKRTKSNIRLWINLLCESRKLPGATILVPSADWHSWFFHLRNTIFYKQIQQYLKTEEWQCNLLAIQKLLIKRDEVLNTIHETCIGATKERA